MNSSLDLSCEEVIELMNRALSKLPEDKQKPLNDNEAAIVQGSMNNENYRQIGLNIHLTENHVTDIGSELWQRLSEALGEHVSKSNFMQPLKRYRNRQASDGNAIRTTPINTSQTKPMLAPRESPEGLVPLDSHFYIERYNLKTLCDETINQPGALLRIKAPQKMGKTSEVERIAQLKKQGCEVVKLNCEVERTVISNLRRLLQHICACVSKELGIDIQLDNYWNDVFDSITNTTNYFEEYLLPKCSKPLLLILDNVDCIFEKSEAKEFCSLLRLWHNTLAKRSDDRGAIWQKLRLIIVHSTDVYSSLEIVNSPLNGVGCVVALEEFNTEQVIKLTRPYKLDFAETEIEQIIYWFGGHPYLLRLALDHLKYDQVPLESLLQKAQRAGGPFRIYLQDHLGILEKHSELATAFQKVIEANKPISIKHIVAFKLESMGLVKMQDDDYWIPSCNLFSQYFRENLKF